MVQSRRRKGKPDVLGSHQRCWFWGRNLALEILEAGRWPVLELHLAEDLDTPECARVRALAAERGIPCAVEAAQRLTALCHSGEHQGYAAKMGPYPYVSPEAALEAAPAGAAPLLAVLDAIQDPFNFGAIVRSAEVLGVHAVLLGERGQTGVNRQVARSSAGAVNRLPIARLEDLEDLPAMLAARGIALVAASESAEMDCTEYGFTAPVALLLGNEGRGIRPGLLECCDARVRIPQTGKIGALNVAAAAAVLFYEAARQRGSLKGEV